MTFRIADLFCGAGGAGMGLHLAGFEVVGFDIEAQPHYPFEFHQADAFQVDLSKFDAVWASPPCQAYTPMTNRLGTKQAKLIPEIREKLQQTQRPWIIENVMGAPLLNSVRLCGSFFNLNVWRHRMFESTMLLFGTPCRHDNESRLAIYGKADGRLLYKRKDGSELTAWVSIEQGKRAMEVPWMQTEHEVKESIPPAYSEFLGEQLIKYMRAT